MRSLRLASLSLLAGFSLLLTACGGDDGDNAPPPPPPQFALSVTKTGSGTVTSTPAGIDCGTVCTANYVSGTVVSLTATPAAGFVFDGWSGACTGSGACSVTVDQARSVGATFIPLFTLSVEKTGQGSVTSSPAGINCGSDCTETYRSGTSVTLSAAPADGFFFAGWSGGGCSGTGACVVTLDASKTVSATFTAVSQTAVMVTLAGDGTGRVLSTPAGIDCGTRCSASFNAGTTITLTATAEGGSQFTGWSGACTGTEPCQLLANTPSYSVTATFAPQPDPAEVLALTAAGEVISFAPAAPELIVTRNRITGLVSGESLVDLDVRPRDGLVYALSTASRVYQLDPATGAASNAFELRTNPADASTRVALTGTRFGIDFNPAADALRIVADDGQNLRVRFSDFATVVDAALGGADTGAVAAGYTHNFAVASGQTHPGTALLVLAADGDLHAQNPPNDGVLTRLATLSVTPDQITGFDITGSNLLAYAALQVSGVTRFYDVNLADGRSTLMGTVGDGGEPLLGLALNRETPVAFPATSFGLIDESADQTAVPVRHRLVSFDLASPTTLATESYLLGLPANEKVHGLDFRPATGELVLVGSSNRLYIANPSTGLITARRDLVPASGSSFSGLSGTSFGIDFNPAADALRIVSSSRQNLRVLVDTGEVFTETALNRGTAAATAEAAGYTNAFADTGATVLYVVDTSGDVLATINTPADGTLSNVGALGVDASAANGFDIDGVNGRAHATLTVGSETALYRLNLGTGAASRVGTLGDGSRVIKGLASRTAAAPLVYVTYRDANSLPRLASLRASAPDTFLSDVAITGLGASEVLIGIDVRAEDDSLWGLTANGNSYRIDRSSGAATLAASLSPSPNDVTDPFLALNGTQYGLDFDPTTTRAAATLRIVGGDDQYLRTRPESGETFTDAGLLLPTTATPPNQSAQCVGNGTPVIIGSAYLNNFASAPADGVARTQLVLASDTRCVYVAPENGDEMTIRT
ncbi:MAG TPA: DUF4394 domain-containing protein, partial [Nevskiaceae bacterium]|nr:DUF4394 domain-containing protein [Nevskiaceae bacterium]